MKNLPPEQTGPYSLRGLNEAGDLRRKLQDAADARKDRTWNLNNEIIERLQQSIGKTAFSPLEEVLLQTIVRLFEDHANTIRPLLLKLFGTMENTFDKVAHAANVKVILQSLDDSWQRHMPTYTQPADNQMVEVLFSSGESENGTTDTFDWDITVDDDVGNRIIALRRIDAA